MPPKPTLAVQKSPVGRASKPRKPPSRAEALKLTQLSFAKRKAKKKRLANVAGKSAAELSLGELRALGAAAGRKAFRDSLAAGVPTPVLVDDQIEFRTDSGLKPRRPK